MLENRLLHFFGVSTQNATNEQYYRAIAMILRDMMTMGRGETVKKSDETGKKNVYYLSMEFLMGRSLKNNLYNLNLTDTFKSVLKDLGVKLDELYEEICIQKRIEMWMEGCRYLDAKRRGETIDRSKSSNHSKSLPSFNAVTYSAHDYRMIYHIPEKEMQNNPEIEADNE